MSSSTSAHEQCKNTSINGNNSHDDFLLDGHAEHYQIWLIDASKFGTFVNGRRIESGSKVKLLNGDKIVFGVQQGRDAMGSLPTFVIEERHVVVVLTGMKSSEKAQLRLKCNSLGIGISGDCNELVSHVVCPSEMRITEKLMLALIQGKRLVTQNWLLQMESCVNFNENFQLPKELDFEPRLMLDGDLFKDLEFKVSVSPDPLRLQLFSNTIFLILDHDQVA